MRPSSALLAASGWIALAASALPALSLFRVLTAVLFIAFCPGAAAMRLAAATRREHARREPLLTAAMTTGASVAIATLVSEAFFLAGGFSAQRCVITLSLLTGAAVLVSEWHARHRRHA